MSNDTTHNLELLSSIKEKSYLTTKETRLYVDSSWMGMISNSYSNEMYKIIETTLNNTVVYLELNMNNYNNISEEYLNKINLLKKSLKTIDMLSENKGFEELSNITENTKQQLDKIEIDLDNLIKNQNKRFYHKIVDYFYNGFEVMYITVYSIVKKLF